MSVRAASPSKKAEEEDDEEEEEEEGGREGREGREEVDVVLMIGAGTEEMDEAEEEGMVIGEVEERDAEGGGTVSPTSEGIVRREGDNKDDDDDDAREEEEEEEEDVVVDASGPPVVDTIANDWICSIANVYDRSEGLFLVSSMLQCASTSTLYTWQRSPSSCLKRIEQEVKSFTHRAE